MKNILELKWNIIEIQRQEVPWTPSKHCKVMVLWSWMTWLLPRSHKGARSKRPSPRLSPLCLFPFHTAYEISPSLILLFSHLFCRSVFWSSIYGWLKADRRSPPPVTCSHLTVQILVWIFKVELAPAGGLVSCQSSFQPGSQPVEGIWPVAHMQPPSSWQWWAILLCFPSDFLV